MNKEDDKFVNENWDWFFGDWGKYNFSLGSADDSKIVYLLSNWFILGHPLWLVVMQGIFTGNHNSKVHLQLVYLKTSLVYNV